MENAGKKSTTMLWIFKGILVLLLNVIFYAIVVLCAVEVCKFSYEFSHEIFGEVMSEPAPGRDIVFKIDKDEDVLNISKRLESQRLIKSAYPFYIKMKLSMSSTTVVVAGEHRLNTSMTSDEICEKILRGVGQ
ncbi:MAG: hypothetical protein K6G63_06275 [Eubacterium sp.]|nr:hypothetical protein [Eubacterium sp.]